MSAVMVETDTDVFKRTEQRLYQWGNERGRAAQNLGIPTSSSIAQVLDSIRAREIHRRLQRAREKTRRQARKKKAQRVRLRPRTCEKCGHIFTSALCQKCNPPDSKDVAIALGLAERTLTARGTASARVKAPDALVLSSAALAVEKIVLGLAGWMKSCIYRSYAYNQPDRIAAKELRMPRREYTSNREAAVEHVAEKLAERKSASV